MDIEPKNTDWCMKCKKEVRLFGRKFEVKSCPNCGKPIKPCSKCTDHAEGNYNCDECKLDKKETK